MEITIKINGRMTVVEVSAEVAETLWTQDGARPRTFPMSSGGIGTGVNLTST